MILVNTSRTVKDDMPQPDKLRFTLGVWPFHKSQTLADIEPYADVVVGVSNGVISVVELIDTVVLSSDGERFEILAKPHSELATELDALIGQRVMPEYAWRPGQGWPVKYVDDSAAFVDAHHAGPPEVALAGYRLTVDADGTAHLYMPRGGDVHVHAAV